MQNHVKTYAWIIVLSVAGFFTVRYLLFGSSVVPPEFIEARQKGASLAEQVAFLSNKSLASLNEISKYDADKNYSEALIRISRALIENKEINDRAVQLSTQLARMAERVPEIGPTKGRQIASEAITYEVALVSRLIGYNNTLRELFELLKRKFTGMFPDVEDGVAGFIASINTDAKAINGLNEAFTEALQRFDAVYK